MKCLKKYVGIWHNIIRSGKYFRKEHKLKTTFLKFKYYLLGAYQNFESTPLVYCQIPLRCLDPFKSTFKLKEKWF